MRKASPPQTFPCFHWPRITLLAVVLLILGSASAIAQTGMATAPGSAATGVVAAVPISVPQILVHAEEDQQQVDGVKRLLAAPDPVDELWLALDGIAGPVNAKLSNGGRLKELPVMRLESLARHWEFDARRFERWETHARSILAPYGESALSLAQRRAAWSATRAEGLMNGLPPALAARVDSILAQIDACESALGVAMAHQFELTQRASELKARIQAGRSDIAAAIDDIDRRLLQTDVPPLWLGLGSNADHQATLEAIHRGLEIERQFAVDYNAAATGNRQALRMVQILLLPLILWLAFRNRKPRGDTATNLPTRALQRPISSWLLLSMLAVLVLEPDAPQLVQELALLVTLVPVLRLLPSGILRTLGVWPYIAVALYGLDRLGAAAVVDTSLYRLFLLGLNGLVLGLTLWLLRGAPPADGSGTGRLRSLVPPVGWTVVAVLTVAAAANITGNVSLAEMLTSGVIDSGYMALLLYASVVAALGMLSALLGQPGLANRRLVRQHEPMLQALFSRLLVLGAWLGWLVYSMDRFRVLRPLHKAGATILAIGIDVGEVSVHLGDVLVFALSIWLAVWTARAVRAVLRDELPSHAGLSRGVGNSIASLSYYGVLLLGLLVALSAAGFKVSQLALVFGALGVGIGFGLQNVVNNFVSGLVLMFERPIQPGDVVDAAGSSGTVRVIGLRATTIRTFEGADVVVPNGMLLSGNLTNWTMFDRSRRIEITVGVAFGSDPAHAIAVLTAAAKSTSGIADHPPPVVLMSGFGESALNFVVRAWTHEVNDWAALRGDMLARILGALQEAGISVPYGQIDLHLRSVPASLEAFSTFVGNHSGDK